MMMEGVEIKDLIVHKDYRGWLAEIFRPEDLGNTTKGQVTITTALPGIVKANHYHARKNEWYCVIEGKIKLVLKEIKTGYIEDFILSADKLQIIKIPPNVSHGFKSIGEKEAYVLMYIDEPFDKNNPDTFADVVVE